MQVVTKVGVTRRPAGVKMRARALVAVALLVLWGLAAFSGILLWLAPSGPRSGQLLLLLGLTKSQRGEAHLWFSVAASLVTVVHVAIDWRGLRACVRYLTNASRTQGVCQ
jgi:hypothetical protein